VRFTVLNLVSYRWCAFLAALCAGLSFFAGTAHGSVSLSWNATGDLTTAGYYVFSGTSSGVYTQEVDVGNATATTVGNLDPGTVYYFVIAAYNGMGTQGAPSNEVNFENSTAGSVSSPTYTAGASSVTGTSVIFTASVNPNGTAGPTMDPNNVYVWWQFGLSAGTYLQKTIAQAIGTGTSALSVAATLPTAMMAQTLYHYQVVVSSSAGVIYGPDQMFSLQPAVAGVSQIGSGSNTSLSVVVNPNGVNTTVSIQWGSTADYEDGSIALGTTGAGTTPLSLGASLPGTAVNTIYHYRVVTSSALGTVYGPDQTYNAISFGTTSMVQTGAPAPGIASSTINKIGNPSVNEQQHIAFQSTILGTNSKSGVNSANNQGIWADIGTNGLSLVVRSGQAAPGYTQGSVSGTFATLSDPVYANDDSVGFMGKLVMSGTVYSSNATGIWATTAGAMQLVARQGDMAPDDNGNPTPTVFAQFVQFVLPDSGGIAFLANLQNGWGGVTSMNNQGIWAVGSDGVLRMIACKGSIVKVNGVAKAILALTAFEPPTAASGQSRHFTSQNMLVYRATFNDGTSGVLQSVYP
jgi:hypothetical protein